jgi:hypothetical protein
MVYDRSPKPSKPTNATEGVSREAVAYFFGVVNKSEAVTIKNVQVKIKEITPHAPHLGDYLPMPLFQKNDNDPGPRAQTFNLNPGDTKLIDLVDAIADNDFFNIRHIVSGINTHVPSNEKHRLVVEITAENTPKTSVAFEVWKDHHDGLLRCVML